MIVLCTIYILIGTVTILPTSTTSPNNCELVPHVLIVFILCLVFNVALSMLVIIGIAVGMVLVILILAVLVVIICIVVSHSK